MATTQMAPDNKTKLNGGTKRLNINLPESTFQILEELSNQTKRSMTDIVRTAIGLAIIAMREQVAGNKLAVMSEDERLLKEIVFPK